MYSWRKIRAVCAILLLLPLVHLAYLVSRETLASLDASPEAWAHELNAYARADQLAQLPKDPLLVVGGIRVKLWRDLENILAPEPVLMRGLGDATVNDITYNYQRLIGYYQPETVVLLPGNSEFHIREVKSAEQLVAAIRKLVELDSSHGVTRRFYVLAPLKTPLYPADNPKIDRVTRLLQAWAQDNPHAAFLDANRLLTRADGSPDPSYYRTDGVNLNEHGYLRLSMLLWAQLSTAVTDQINKADPHTERNLR